MAGFKLIRLLVYFFALSFVTIYCDLIGRVWCLAVTPRRSPARVRRANALIRHWNVVLTRLTLTLLNTRLEIRGQVPAGRFLVLSNHQSTADLAVISAALSELNLKFVAKAELGRGIPGVSMALRHFGSALVSRPATRGDIKHLKQMADDLSYWEGSVVVVFPEGTRSRDGQILPYRRGVVRILAEHTRLPILPVAIDGTQLAVKLSDFPKLVDRARGIVTIGSPIPPDRWEGRLDQVLQEVQVWASDTVARTRADSRVGFERGPANSDSTLEA